MVRIEVGSGCNPRMQPGTQTMTIDRMSLRLRKGSYFPGLPRAAARKGDKTGNQ